jgi:hypothetical protein
MNSPGMEHRGFFLDRISIVYYLYVMAKKKLDMNQLAKAITDIATRETEKKSSKDSKEEPVKNPAAVALGRLGGLKGGKARAAKLSSKKRSEIAKNAARTRWAKRSS